MRVTTVFLLLAALAAATPVPCSTSMLGQTYDLSPLSYDPSASSPSGYSYTDSGNTYFVNFCNAVSDEMSSCNKAAPSGSCQLTSDILLSAGTVESEEFLPFTPDETYTEGIAIKYTGGEACPSFGINRQTTINVACDPSAGTGSLYNLTASGCSYTLYFKSVYGCPQTTACNVQVLVGLDEYPSVNVFGSTVGLNSSTTSCSPAASGKYQWYQVTPSKDCTITATANFPATNFPATVGISNGDCSSPQCMNQGTTAPVSVTATAGEVLYISVGSTSSGGTFQLNVAQGPIIPKTFLVPLAVNSSTVIIGTTTGAALSSSPCDDSTVEGVWYTLTGALPPALTITSCNPGTSTDTQLVLVTGRRGNLQCQSTGSECTNAKEFNGSTLEFPTQSGETYTFGVYNPSGPSGDFEIVISPTSN